MELNELTAHQLSKMIKEGKTTSREITEAVYKRIEEVEDKVKAYLTLTKELALKEANRIDKIRKETSPPVSNPSTIQPSNHPTIQPSNYPISGIPIALKDNLCTKGIPTTCSSKILKGFVPPYDATVVEKIKNLLPFLGKTNLDEFAMGSSTENSAFFTTHNPWDLSFVPGGSSGGSAAAVAADEAIWALGSDTGGSIRQPASFCGVVGLKPTYGRVSRYGLVAFASSLDQIGPITKDVEDCALLLNLISGYDQRDSTSAQREVPDYTKSLVNDVKGVKIGIPREFFGEGIEEGVNKAVRGAIKTLESLGAKVSEVSLPHIEYSLPTYYILAPAEASSNLARYDGIHYGYRSKESKDLIDLYKESRSWGFGKEVKRRIMLGTYALSAGYYDAYYLKAQKVRTKIVQDFELAFRDFDVLITPTSSTVSFKIGEKVDDPLKMYLSDICTIPINLAALPAISIPCGMSNNLPVGLQIISSPFAEETILRVAYTYEQNTNWHKEKPKGVSRVL
ncbi:MAG: Asp-tRNA(Asn)/Glu-tRNA(Gln) amidotransferase GatCAB subunit A [Armatimonadetes bacterium CG07_land_8_20_14_0_80_40_9]|nr:MAG: Asp-tRNA(Asn)/Glu-tRNA(Gln) amidotransferase GatCAB subunit A [Armatimonadetes bacterium CG07_land_8_20_14_0_80_40_9]